MKRLNPKMQEKMKEALTAVMPIVAIVLVQLPTPSKRKGEGAHDH